MIIRRTMDNDLLLKMNKRCIVEYKSPVRATDTFLVGYVFGFDEVIAHMVILSSSK